MNIPAQITSGDLISWDDDATSDNLGNTIDSSLFDLTYAILGAVKLTTDAGAVQGSGWRSTVTAAQSATLSEGDYFWQAYATKKSDATVRHMIGSGSLKVLPNLSGKLAGFDGRSQNQQDLEAVQAARRAMVSGGAVQEYSIGGRSLRKIDLTELITLESKLKYEVAREKAAESMKNGLGNPNNVFVRFR